MNGADLSLDESVWQVVADPLLHLVRNAVDHGIEHRGKVTITAEKLSDELKIRVIDDGRGIDPELIATGRLFESGFSTAPEVSEISGRGVGLDVVKTTVEDTRRIGESRKRTRPGLDLSNTALKIRLPWLTVWDASCATSSRARTRAPLSAATPRRKRLP